MSQWFVDVSYAITKFLLGTHSSFLLQAAQLNNTLALILPHHPPEIIHSRFEGTLCGYIGTTLPVPLRGKVQDILILLQELAFIVAYIDKAGIDVVRAMSCC